MNESSTVWCPKEGKNIPIWHCTGSFTQARERCRHMVKLVVRGTENQAQIECDFDKEQEV